jgi:hypothetical protein
MRESAVFDAGPRPVKKFIYGGQLEAEPELKTIKRDQETFHTTRANGKDRRALSQ